MGIVPGNVEWLLAFIYAVAPGIVAWSVSGDFSLAWLRGFLPGVAPGIFACTDSKDFATYRRAYIQIFQYTSNR